MLDDEDDDDDKQKKSDAPMGGKDMESNLFKSRSIFIYGTITRPAMMTSGFSSAHPVATSNPAMPFMTWCGSSSRRSG